MAPFLRSKISRGSHKRPFLRFIFFIFFWIFSGILVFFIWLSSILPPLSSLKSLKHKSSIAILDNQGKLLTTYGDFHGDVVQAKNLPKHLIHALLAIEDRRFYQHFGVDPWGVLRALYSNFRSGHVRQGGSTITQQLARNFLQKEQWFTYKDRSFKRKICELILALKIEFSFSKEDILTMYLNTVYMGSGTWGIEAAAMKYFGRHAKDLRLYDAAVLMGLLRAPSKYSPSNNKKRSENRARQVLDAMVEGKFLTPEAAKVAMAIPSPLQKNLEEKSFLYFTDWVMDEIHDVVDTNQEDLIVTTTLNSDLQNIAHYQSQEVMKTYGQKWKAKEQAFVSMTPDGAVVAMIGGQNYAKSPFNRASQSFRQPGSAFKYFVFLTALEEGLTPDSLVSDIPVTLKKWRAKNFKYRSVGEIPLELAFAKSVNASAVRLIMQFGVRRVIEMARRLGIQAPIRPDQENYTLALGTMGTNLVDMVSAFGAMANKGRVVRAYGIQRIVTKKGQVIYERDQVLPDPVLDKEVVQEMRQLMKAVMTKGTGRLGQIPKMDLYGKTGTSNKGTDDRDLWKITIGYFPKGMHPQYPCLIAGAWTGNDDEKAMSHQNGGSPSLHMVRLFNASVFVYQMNHFQGENEELWKKKDYENIPGLNGTLDKKLLKDVPEDEGEGEEDDEDHENTRDNEEFLEKNSQENQEENQGEQEDIIEDTHIEDTDNTEDDFHDEGPEDNHPHEHKETPLNTSSSSANIETNEPMNPKPLSVKGSFHDPKIQEKIASHDPKDAKSPENPQKKNILEKNSPNHQESPQAFQGNQNTQGEERALSDFYRQVPAS